MPPGDLCCPLDEGCPSDEALWRYVSCLATDRFYRTRSKSSTQANRGQLYREVGLAAPGAIAAQRENVVRYLLQAAL